MEAKGDELHAASAEPHWRIRALRMLLRRVPRGRYRLLAALAPAHGHLVAPLADDLGAARFPCDLADALSREVVHPPAARLRLPRLDD